MRLKTITSVSLIVCFSALSVQAAELNCSLRQNSNFVEDSYGMYDAANSEEECQLICEKYAAERVVSLAESDVITDLSWTCTYNAEDIHTEVLVEGRKS